jgi:hypothetical protein
MSGRVGCCDDQRQPCSYHEGWQDALDQPVKHDDIPNPGSDAAMALGCQCAVLDNNHGKSAPWPDNGWWITVGCPVHMPVNAG